MNKKRLLYLILILTLLLVSNCYSEYNHMSGKDKKVEKDTCATCITRQDYVAVQESECSFPQTSVQEIPNIDKSMIIQGNSAIDPYMLIAPPSYMCIESSKIATPPPDNK